MEVNSGRLQITNLKLIKFQNNAIIGNCDLYTLNKNHDEKHFY